MACACGTSSSSTKKTKSYPTVGDSDNLMVHGSLVGGAEFNICNLTSDKRYTLVAARTPNVLVFGERPCVAAGTGLIISNTDLLSCFTNVTECLTATAAPVQVGSNYEVTTSASWTSTSGNNTVTFPVATFAPGCDASPTPAPSVAVCGGTPIANNFSGYLYTRPLNSNAMTGAVYVIPGGPVISAKDSSFVPKKGDRITLSDTAITGANAATVTNVTQVVTNGVRTATITLDRNVTGVTASVVDGRACVSGTAEAQPIAYFTFSPSCNCCVTATLSSSITNRREFPQGTLVDHDGCKAQEYCFVINDRTTGAKISTYSGKIHLK